jgi:hypothetical protein
MVLLALVVPGLVFGGATYFPVPGDNGRAAAASAANRKAINAARSKAIENDATGYRRLEALAKAPWRVVDGVTNSIYAPGWVHFWGTVLKTDASRAPARSTGGMRVDGMQGLRVKGGVSLLSEDGGVAMEFFVVNFPYEYVENDVIEESEFCMAKVVGTVTLGSTKMRKLDYGRVIPTPPEVIAAAAAKAAKAKNASDAAVLKLDQEKSAAGSALYQVRMGRRYLVGKGVEPDLGKARELFEKAAAQGNEEAAAELKKRSVGLPAGTNSVPRQ